MGGSAHAPVPGGRMFASTWTSIRQGLPSFTACSSAPRTVVERRAVLTTVEVRVLQVADCRPGDVVPYDPDGRDVVLHRRAQYMRHHSEAAVAANRDARPIRRGELRSQDRARPEAHAGIPPGIEHRLRPARLPELHEPVVVDARIERDDRFIGQHGAAVGDDALGPYRLSVRLEIWPHVLLPLLAPAGDLALPLLKLC